MSDDIWSRYESAVGVNTCNRLEERRQQQTKSELGDNPTPRKGNNWVCVVGFLRLTRAAP